MTRWPGFFRKLARLWFDHSGNTLAIAAASLLPLTALIGGGVDISRAYMAKTQLQSACDAGVLAGRRAMSKSGVYGRSEKAKANSMFNFNFNGDALDVQNVSYVTEDNDDGQVLGTARAVVPTLLMKIFKKDTVDLSVNCMAELQIGNADVMFVLDTTGSMGQSINYGEPSKISGLRDAVKDFHRTINQAVNDNRTRVRYGFVPYSMSVNVKGLIESGDLPLDYLTDATAYQTRSARFATAVYVANSPTTTNTTETYSSAITQSNCDLYVTNDYPSSGNNPVNSGGPAPSATVVTTYSKPSGYWTKTSGSGSSAKGTCKRGKSVVTTTYSTQYQFTNWVYQPVSSIDTSTFKGFSTTKYVSGISSSSRTTTSGTWDLVTLAKKVANGTATGITTSNSTWDGCIEERKSETPSWSYDFDPVPDDAYDLDLDTSPSDADTSWRPKWENVEFTRGSQSAVSYYLNASNNKYYLNSSFSGSSQSLPGNASSACPAKMMLLRSVELSDDPNDVPGWLNTYLNNLNAEGNTYHDLGMIWGGRLTSPTGLFADNVNLDADKISVSKHIIFMTDGIMEPSASGYSAYGIENLDHRIAPSGYESTITARHNARFSAMCEAIKAKDVTIWVVAFGTSMTTELRNCASSGRAYYSSNTEQLRNTFKYIAAQVADLRLGA